MNDETTLGMWGSLEQIARVLGFHDVGSFFMTGIFVVVALAAVVSFAIVLVKSRRERREHILKVVDEVQKDALAAREREQQPPSKIVEKVIEIEAKKPVAQPIKPRVEHVHRNEPVVAEILPVVSPSAKGEMPNGAAPLEAKDEVAEILPVVPSPPPKVETPKVVARTEEKREVRPIKPVIPPPPPKVETPKVVARTEEKSEVKTTKAVISAPSTKVDVAETTSIKQPAAIPVEPPAADIKKELGAALKNTRGGFMEKLARLWSRGPSISDDDFEEMEAILFTADIGAKTAQKLLDVMRERVKLEKASDKTLLRGFLKDEMTKILESAKPAPLPEDASPKVLMFVGVNGAGKTTTMAKLGARLSGQGQKVLFGAGDTFRAAAVEQLAIWGERVGAPVVSGKENGDAAAVLFEAIEKAKSMNIDYVLCDTAGRLHTKVGLMEELKKVHRVVSKAQVGAPHEVLLVVDATMGQNAINQAREFAAATPLTGVVLSKLDGTAKGGVALGIVDELKVPIRYIGIGEKAGDLKEFDAKLFVDALFGE